MPPIEDSTRALSTPNAPVEQREAIARALMEQFHNPDESWFVPEDEYEASKFLVKCADAILAVRLDEAAIRKDEREKCAVISEWKGYATTGRQIASAIRNGGKQP